MDYKYGVIGTIFFIAVGMGTINNTQLQGGKQPSFSHYRAVLISCFHSWIYNLQASFNSIFKKQRMDKIKAMSLFINWIGIPAAALAWWDNIDNWKGGIMTALGAICAVCYAYLTYQKARKIKLENDKLEFEMWMKKHGHNP